MATLLCLRIPDDIKEHEKSLLEKKQLARQEKHVGSSRSLINNVLDLSDTLEYMPSGARNNANVGEGVDAAPIETELGPEPFLNRVVNCGGRSVGEGEHGDYVHSGETDSSNEDTGERPCDAGDIGEQRTCCQYRTQMKYILRELKCLANKVHGDDKKDSIKK